MRKTSVLEGWSLIMFKQNWSFSKHRCVCFDHVCVCVRVCALTFMVVLYREMKDVSRSRYRVVKTRANKT